MKAVFIPPGQAEWANRRLAIFGGLWLFGALDIITTIAAVLNTSTPLLETVFQWATGGFVVTLITYVTGATIDQLTRLAGAARGNVVNEETTTTRTIEPAPAVPAVAASPASP